MTLHLYDQDHRWVAGGRVLPDLDLTTALARVAAVVATLPPDPGEPAPSVAGYHERQALPGRCGRPAMYATDTRMEPRHLPQASLMVPVGPVFATDARDAHLQGHGR